MYILCVYGPSAWNKTDDDDDDDDDDLAKKWSGFSEPFAERKLQSKSLVSAEWKAQQKS